MKENAIGHLVKTNPIQTQSKPIKANLKRAKMNINSLITKDYRKKDDFAVRKNKPNSNPISEKPKMNANAFLQKDYENKTAFRLQKNKPNSNPILPTPKGLKQKSEVRCLSSVFCLLSSVLCPLSSVFCPLSSVF